MSNILDGFVERLYVQVIDPKSNTLGLNEQVTFGGKSLNYSIISKFNYENANLDICEFVASKGKSDFQKDKH